MSIPHFVECEPAITGSDLDKVESELGIVLPHDLRQHFLKYNGGRPLRNCYPFGDDLFEIRYFCSIKYGGTKSMEGWYGLMAEAIPQGMIPFATDSGGNDYCYSVRKETMHSVCYWNHEYYQHADEGIKVLAPDLETFLSALTPDPYVD